MEASRFSQCSSLEFFNYSLKRKKWSGRDQGPYHTSLLFGFVSVNDDWWETTHENHWKRCSIKMDKWASILWAVLIEKTYTYARKCCDWVIMTKHMPLLNSMVRGQNQATNQQILNPYFMEYYSNVLIPRWRITWCYDVVFRLKRRVKPMRFIHIKNG